MSYEGKIKKARKVEKLSPLLYPEPGSKIAIFCNAMKSDEMYIISRYTTIYKD